MNWPGFWEGFTFVNYVGAGPLTWLGYGASTLIGHHKMKLLDKPRPAPQSRPPVSLLIPAKDEELRIKSCIQSALDQDYPNLEVIAIDDRSVDRTGAILDEMAASDPRLKVIHIQEGALGPGWTGKNNALFTATRTAKGDWLLFVDSDVLLQPMAVTRMVTVSAYKKYDLLSLLPTLEAHTIWESMLIPLCSGAAATMYLIGLSNDDKMKKIAFGNGQIMLSSRRAYDAIGGHEVVKDRFCEDTEIARLMKERDFRTRVSWGSDLAAVRMYSSLPAIIKGWSRIYYAAKVGNPKHVLLAMNFLIINCFSAFAVMIYGAIRAMNPHGNMLDDAWLVTGIIHWLVMTVVLSFIYRWSKNSPWHALLFPIAGPMLMWVLIKALIMCITKKVEWRGTSYSHKMAQDLAAKS